MVKSKTPSKSEAKATERLDPSSRGNTVAEESEAKGPLAFLQTTREELEKVVWPSRQQLLSESVAVLSIVVVFALFIYAIDKGFSWVALQIFK